MCIRDRLCVGKGGEWSDMAIPQSSRSLFWYISHNNVSNNYPICRKCVYKSAWYVIVKLGAYSTLGWTRSSLFPLSGDCFPIQAQISAEKFKNIGYTNAVDALNSINKTAPSFTSAIWRQSTSTDMQRDCVYLVASSFIAIYFRVIVYILSLIHILPTWIVITIS